MVRQWGIDANDQGRVVSPAWHRDVLRCRREQVQQGKASFPSWDTAMAALRSEQRKQRLP